MRLVALGDVIDQALEALGPDHAETTRLGFRRLLDALFPHPERLGGSGFSAWLGIVVDARRPGHLAELVTGDGLGLPRAAGVASRDGELRPRLYAAPRSGQAQQLVVRVAQQCALAANELLGVVHRVGLARPLWNGDVIVEVEHVQQDRLDLHLSGRRSWLAGPRMDGRAAPPSARSAPAPTTCSTWWGPVRGGRSPAWPSASKPAALEVRAGPMCIWCRVSGQRAEGLTAPPQMLRGSATSGSIP